MRQFGRLTGAFVGALILWGCAGASDAEKGIREGNARWMEAFNKGDAPAVAALYADGARLMPPDSPTLSGRQAIEEFCKGMLGAGARDMRLDTVEVTASGDLAAETGTFAFRMQPPGGESTTVAGKYVVVWKRQPDGAWKLAYDIFNSNAPPAAK